MKKTLLGGLLVILNYLPVFSQTNLSGSWTGFLLQNPGGIQSVYEFGLTIEQTGSLCKGKSYIATNGDVADAVGNFTFQGRLTGKTLTYQELSLVKNTLRPSVGDWCTKSATLTVTETKDSLILTGPWTGKVGNTVCFPGTLRVSRKKTTVFVSKTPVKPQNNLAPAPKPDWFPETIQKGDILSFPNLAFRPSSAEFQSDAYFVMETLAEYLRKHPSIQIEIHGHTDIGKNDAYNLALSQERANQVAEYLIQKGKIDTKRIHTKGHGATKPVAENTTIEGRRKNRRVEFRIL